MTPMERFNAKVIPEPNSGCYLWTAAVGSSGYAHFGLNGKVCDAHRLSYEWFVGKIPEGMFVLHRCDIPSCVRPDHLFLGTQTDNLSDMTTKGRRRCGVGESHGAAKLTNNQVEKIRADTRSNRTIAPEYRVGKSTIGAIKAGTSWRTV